MIERFDPELKDVDFTDDVEIVMEKYSVGEYVRFDDVSILLQTIGMALIENGVDKAHEIINDALTYPNGVDLRKCKKGDKLRIRTNEWFINKGISDIVVYKEPIKEGDILRSLYQHVVVYSDGSEGTRCDNGNAFALKRLPTDPDVIEILEN
jgi:hypothetical protein